MTATTISKICLVEGCERRAIKRGRCDTDYHRFRRTPAYKKRLIYGTGDTPDKRFWSRVNKNGPMHPTDPRLGRCWEWTAGRCGGYGTASLNSKVQKAHQIAWFYTYGYLPADCLLHRCDNPRCVRPSHLFEGSHLENIQDKVNKNRQAKGVATNRTHLTDADIIAIRQKYVPQYVTLAKLADEYGVSDRTIWEIVKRRSWRHVP